MNDADDQNWFSAEITTFGDRIAGGREAAGMTQTQLSRETLYRTLSARGNPTIKTLAAVLKATGLKISIAPVT